MSMDVQVPVGASTSQKRTMDLQGIEAHASGSAVTSMKVASMTSSGPALAVESVTETVTGLEVSASEGLAISFDHYRADVTGLDGSEGYVEATGVSSTQDGEISGDYVYVHTVTAPGSSFLVRSYGGFDVAFGFDDSAIVSAEAVPCSNMYLGDHYTGIEPYDPASGGLPYELVDGTAVFTPGEGGTIDVSVGLATFAVTVNGTAADYSYGSALTVSASTSQEGMVFAGWYDGIQVAMPGGEYIVRYDAEVRELWVPADYDVVHVEGGLAVDIGEGGVFYVADVSTLRGARNIGPTTDLTVTNSIGSVTVDLEDIGSGPLIVIMSEMGEVPLGYINDATTGSKV